MSRVNPAAVVVSGIVFWIIQAGWYTAFGQAWVEAAQMPSEVITEAKAHPSIVPYLTALLSNILIAYVISIVMRQSGAVVVSRGMIVAFVLWGGIVMTTLATQYGFARKPFALLAIDGGSTLIGMLACGVICGAWPKKAKAPTTAVAGA
jgi:hypothetical protein